VVEIALALAEAVDTELAWAEVVDTSLAFTELVVTDALVNVEVKMTFTLKVS
jgi:hypothetical protein